MRLGKRRLEYLALLMALGCSHKAPPAATATPPPPPQPPPAAAPTWSAADVDTIAELLRLEDRREFETARFSVWMQASADEVRRRAAISMGRIGDRRATPLLLTALSDSSARVRRDAAFALGILDDSSTAVVNGLWKIAMGNDSAAVEAITALSRLGGGYSIVESRVNDANASPQVRGEALLALAHYARTPRIAQVILPQTANPDPEIRWRAAYALTRGTSDPAVVPYLQKLLTDSDPLVRALAARGLRAATADSAGTRVQSLTALRSALTDADPRVRINVVRSLALYRDTSTLPAITNLLTDQDGNVVIAALEALGNFPSTGAQLEQVARTAERPIGIRNAALVALTRSAPDRATAVATEWRASPQWLLRLLAVRALIATRSPTGEGLARQAVADSDPRVAAAALQFVVAADTLNPPYTLFIQKIADRDPEVRAAALRGLQRRASPADLEMLLRAYERAQQDTVIDAAVAAVDALGELARQDVPVDRSFFLRFKKPRDPLLLERILDRLGAGTWGNVRPIDTGKPQSFYSGVARHFLQPDSTRVRPRVRITTAGGEIVLELNPQEAPLTVLNFVTLAEHGYFNNGRWHRVVPNFVLQDGDPRGDGEGGPGYVIRDEINRLRYTRGAVGMALAGPDTGGSQFFITHSPQPHLDGGYTVFGYVVSGMEVADHVIQDDAITRIEVIR